MEGSDMQDYSGLLNEAKEIMEVYKKTKRLAECAECGELKEIKAKGLCVNCYTRLWKREKVKRSQSQCEMCGASIRGDELLATCNACAGGIGKPAKTGKVGKCRICCQSFELVKGQHSTLHWCPKCEKSPEYREFGSAQWLNNSTKTTYAEVKQSELAMF